MPDQECEEQSLFSESSILSLALPAPVFQKEKLPK